MWTSSLTLRSRTSGPVLFRVACGSLLKRPSRSRRHLVAGRAKVANPLVPRSPAKTVRRRASLSWVVGQFPLILVRQVSALLGLGAPYRGIDVRDQLWRVVLLREDVSPSGHERLKHLIEGFGFILCGHASLRCHHSSSRWATILSRSAWAILNSFTAASNTAFSSGASP